MKDGKDIETMLSRFQTLVFGLKVLNKSYTTLGHIKSILRSLHVRLRPKLVAIHKTKDINKVSLDNLIRSLKSREIE